MTLPQDRIARRIKAKSCVPDGISNSELKDLSEKYMNERIRVGMIKSLFLPLMLVSMLKVNGAPPEIAYGTGAAFLLISMLVTTFEIFGTPSLSVLVDDYTGLNNSGACCDYHA